jgi:hypothetical protein
MRLQRRKVSFVSVIAALGVLVAAWYLISPLFFDRTVDEELPTSQPAVTEQESAVSAAVEATDAMNEALTEVPVEVSEPMPEGELELMIVLATGEFYDVAHEGMGTATIYQLEDGSRVLRFENFEVLNGPQLHVWLTSASLVENTIGVELPGYFDLGPLKGNIGDQNYEIPADLDLSLYNSVVIWCVPFRVSFNAAPLTPQ